MEKPIRQPAVIVFVCEHGSAKSVVAAAHFNKLARERDMNLRAVSRGTNPDEEIAPKASERLQADGLAVGGEKPRKLSAADAAGAIRIITFCQLPESHSNAAPVEMWTDIPPVSESYGKARDAIVERIKRLLDELKSPK
ncbi:MAG TPA: hypothetical protein VFM05_00160 [Candidatus Saccharimonadales bacterium]|nr:hypothetical protein [Candidatus Saccharimonadales bacterium]